MAELPAAKASLMPVATALELILDGAAPLGSDEVGLADAAGRVLAGRLTAKLTQPPFPASAMDGYAVQAAEATLGARLTVIGEAAAGRPFAGRCEAGAAVRVFTGSPVPMGADAVVIQEDTRREGEQVEIMQAARPGENVRAEGGDFRAGEDLIAAGRLLGARDLMLAASAGHARLAVHRRPVVAILATGDELVMPGETPGDGQIVSSIPAGLAALVAAAGGLVRPLGIARDTLASLDEHIAAAGDADILVTIGGASVGDHDLVHEALSARGLQLAFWKIAMRPGKPLMFGRLRAQRVLGLPGNPVSAMLCAHVFLVPLLRALTGRPPEGHMGRARLAEDLPANGPRQHYMRAVIRQGGLHPLVAPLPSQDSSLMKALAEADCLIVVPAGSPALKAGADVTILPI